MFDGKNDATRKILLFSGSFFVVALLETFFYALYQVIYHQGDCFAGVVVARYRKIYQSWIGVGIDHTEGFDIQFVGFGKCQVLVVNINDKYSVRQAVEGFNTTELLVHFLIFAV